MAKSADPDLPFGQRLKWILAIHWRGMLAFIIPLIGLGIVLPKPDDQALWCGYGLFVMAVFWVSECIPLPVTSFIPIALFPFADIITTYHVSARYFNGTLMMFLASLMLAAAIEQSGLHLRIALFTIKSIGYSHYKLLFAVGLVTMVISMWITNTAATTMCVPIVFALLRVFERNKFLTVFHYTADGDPYASKWTTCYFCMTTFSATIGGIGTLVGTGTNLVFRGLYQSNYPNKKDSLNFVQFSGFAVPYMILLEAALYFSMIFKYFGFLRPGSEAAKQAKINVKGIEAAKAAVLERYAALGRIKFWEYMVIIIFPIAMAGFFLRSPQVFDGWADLILHHFDITEKNAKKGYIGDAAWACLILVLMFLLPGAAIFFKSWSKSIKVNANLPKERAHGILKWKEVNATTPWSFLFLLGGGFALSTCADKKYTDLNSKIGNALKKLENFPHSLNMLIVIAVTIFVTNFASNVVVANVLVPIVQTMAEAINQHPLHYTIAAGFCASFCFCVPVGTPGNLIAQAAANIKTGDMIMAGLMPSFFAIIISWAFMMFWAPIIWSELKDKFDPDTP